MSYIKKIISSINEFSEISSFSITEEKNETYELFYDIHKLETIRTTQTLETKVTIYKASKDKKTIGSSTFLISHKLSKKEIDELIKDALFSASLIDNQYYELPQGDRPKKVKAKAFKDSPFDTLHSIANVFFNEAKEEVKFNSLELFFNTSNIHIVNSNGVDYLKETQEVEVEAIPSYSSSDIKTELYKMFKYKSLDLEKVREDVKTAISDVCERAKAVKLENSQKINVILREEDALDLFEELISNYNFASLYQGSCPNKIGDAIQTNPKTALNITVSSNSKADYFDGDGTIIKDVDVIKDGHLSSFYGSQMFAYYCKMEATGNPSKIIVKNGKKKIEDFKKKPYLEIIALSGIQLDIFAGYIGGEIRLAKFFDGEREYPLTGLAFSGSLHDAINSLELSKESVEINHYKGPKYVILKNMEIM